MLYLCIITRHKKAEMKRTEAFTSMGSYVAKLSDRLKSLTYIRPSCLDLHESLRFYIISQCSFVISQCSFRPVRIRVRIDPPHPLVCHRRRLNGAVLRMRSEKLRSRATACVAR
jgi:hypothetical protein